MKTLHRPKKIRAGRAVITTTLWAYAVLALIPLVVMLLNSFRTMEDMYTNPSPIPSSLTLSGYQSAWVKGSFAAYFVNSVLVTVGAVTLSTAVSLFAAYALARWRFFGSRVIEGIFISGLMIPVMVAILPLFFLVDSLGLIDNLLALVLIYASNGVPFSVYVLAAFFRQVPGELVEAALVDGAGTLRTFISVMLPMVRPAIATVVVFRFVPIWNDFLFPLVMLRSRSNYTLPVGLTAFFGEFATDWSTLFAGLTIAAVPLVILFILATKQIVAGLTAGISK